MKLEIELFKRTRENTLKLIEDLSLEEINKIPHGFNGNIAWNLGHMVATHRGLVYQLNGVESGLDKAFVLKYKKGSVPEGNISETELDFIKEKLFSQIAELEADLSNDEMWGETHVYPTSYNFTISSLQEAVTFSNLHQTLHLGYILALKRVVRTQ